MVTLQQANCVLNEEIVEAPPLSNIDKACIRSCKGQRLRTASFQNLLQRLIFVSLRPLKLVSMTESLRIYSATQRLLVIVYIRFLRSFPMLIHLRSTQESSSAVLRSFQILLKRLLLVSPRSLKPVKVIESLWICSTTHSLIVIVHIRCLRSFPLLMHPRSTQGSSSGGSLLLVVLRAPYLVTQQLMLILLLRAFLLIRNGPAKLLLQKNDLRHLT